MPETPPDRTDAEKEASAAKLRAEAAKAEAEARKFSAEADAAELAARTAKIAYDKLEESEVKRLSKDEHHHVYRFVGEVSKASVEACVEKLTEWHRQDPTCDIEVVFYSPGGSVFDGFVLYDYLRGLSAQGHKVTTGMLGMAASMAGILMQAGDHRWSGAEAWYMIHRAAFGTIGKTFENEDRVEHIKRIEQRIIDIFVKRTNLTKRKIERNWERRDWWLDADQALEAGLVDEIRGGHAPDEE